MLIMKKIILKLWNELHNKDQRIARQMLKEVELLKLSDPDKELKEEFETASLHDLNKYLAD